MTSAAVESNRRILIIDDNPAIHEDFRKIFGAPSPAAGALDTLESALFGGGAAPAPRFEVFIDSAYQGEEGLEMVRRASAAGNPYAMAFVDVRMPPGWDGVETVARIWLECPDLQVVICTAYSDYSWDEMITKLCRNENLLILKKPFDKVEALQLASALTEKWRLSRQARLRLEELEAMVAARTPEIGIANKDLRALTAQLTAAKEAANAAKARFLANVSHEIRTPLTAVLGYADLLLEPDQSPEQREQCVHTIRRHGDNLLQIINDILDLSKIEAGRVKIDLVSCSPGDAVMEVISLLAVRARPTGLRLDAVCDGPVPAAVRTDPIRLRQILTNLIGNALKFTAQGNVRVVLKFHAGSVDGDPSLEFRVIDTGIGIAAEELQQIFTPFSQGNDSTSRRFGGTGLGLTISKKLTEMLGGRIAVESTPGKGSTFGFSIQTGPIAGVPFISQLAPLDPDQGSKSVDSHAPSAIRLSGRVLLAEDSPDNQRLLRYVLERAGAEVEIVGTGTAAVAAALSGRYDLILMDMQMPELDGYAATSLLRNKGYRGPIVALTAHAMTTDRAKCIDAGCDDYATKPIDRSALLRTALTLMTHAAFPSKENVT